MKKILILILMIVVMIRPAFAIKYYYNYSTAQRAEYGHRAYEGNGTSTNSTWRPSDPWDYFEEANNSYYWYEYDYINKSENDRWQTGYAPDKAWDYFIFHFNISENVNDITVLNFSWEWNSFDMESGYNSTLAIWNVTNQSWYEVENSSTGYSSDVVWDGSITSGISDFVNESGGDKWVRFYGGHQHMAGGGSCPYVISWDGDDWYWEHESYPYAVIKVGEMTSYERLDHLEPIDGILKLQLREIFRDYEYHAEYSWTDFMKLYAIDHPDYSIVMPDLQGNMHTIKKQIRPNTCIAKDDQDCLPLVKKFDNAFWTSNLTQDFTKEENWYDWIILEFDKPRKAEIAKIGLHLMKSEAITFAWQHWINEIGKNNFPLMEWMVTNTPEFKNTWIKNIDWKWRVMVQIWNGNDWIKAGAIEAGRADWGEFLINADISDIKTEKLKIRLKATSGFYEINDIFVDYSEDEPMFVNELELLSAIKSDGSDVKDLLLNQDEKYLEMTDLTNDFTELEYQDTKETGWKRDYVVSIRGYYHFRQFTEHQPFLHFLKTVYKIVLPVLYQEGFEAKYFMSKYTESPHHNSLYTDFVELVIITDTGPPTYSLNSTNTTLAGYPCEFKLEWNDDEELSGYIFSTNNSGTWENASWVAFSSTPQNATNVTTLNSTSGIVGWRIYANDTCNDWNASEIFSINTTSIWLNVTLLTPTPNTQTNWIQNNAYSIQARVECIGGLCGIVNGTVRYNASSSLPDTAISITYGATPFLIRSYTGEHFDVSTDGIDNPGGITQNGTYFWITDITGKKVYKYFMNGTYTGDYFNTYSESPPLGITQNGTFIWTVDPINRKVYKYFMNGTYTGDYFNTYSESTFPRNIINNNTYFWITDDTIDKVYKYFMNGTYTGDSFNTPYFNPSGITHNNGYIWIVDTWSEDKVYKYFMNGTYTGDSISIDDETNSPFAITSNNTYFWITDGGDNEVYKFFIKNSQSCGNLTEGDTCQLNWTVNATGDINTYWKIDVNFTSDNVYVNWNHTDDATIKIVIPQVNVTLLTPTPNTQTNWIQNNAYSVLARVGCMDANCGNVNGTVRYNASSSLPDTAISITEGDTPFYIQELRVRPVSYSTSTTGFGNFAYEPSCEYSDPRCGYDYDYNDTDSYLEIYIAAGAGGGTARLSYNYSILSDSATLFATLNGFNMAIGEYVQIYNFTNNSWYTWLTEPPDSTITYSIPVNTSSGLINSSTLILSGYASGTDIPVLDIHDTYVSYVNNTGSCGNLTQGDYCQLDWIVNTTGDINTYWKIDVNFTSDNTIINWEDTNDALIRIVGGINAYLRGVALYYYTGEKVNGNVTIIPVGDPGGKATIRFTNGEWSYNFYLDTENVEYLTAIVDDSQKIGYNELKLKPEEADLTCSVQDISICGYSVDVTNGDPITSGKVRVSILDTDYTNTTTFSGTWNIDFHPCLIAGRIYTLQVLVTDNTGKRGEFLQKYPAK